MCHICDCGCGMPGWPHHSQELVDNNNQATSVQPLPLVAVEPQRETEEAPLMSQEENGHVEPTKEKSEETDGPR